MGPPCSTLLAPTDEKRLWAPPQGLHTFPSQSNAASASGDKGQRVKGHAAPDSEIQEAKQEEEPLGRHGGVRGE